MQEPITSASASLSVPPLLFIFCALSAMGFILSTLHWLYQARKTFPAKTLPRKVWTDQIYILVGGTLFSLIHGLCAQFFWGAESNLSGEFAILAVVTVAFAFHTHIRKRSIHRAIIRKIIYTALLFLACFSGWVFTFVIGVLSAQVTYIFLPPTVDPTFSGVIICGLWWFIPVSLLYWRMEKRRAGDPAYGDMRFHHFLWPLVLACFVLLMPLTLQDFMASGKWREIENARPLKII